MCVCVWRSQLSTLTEILFREPGPAFVGRGVTRRRNVREKGTFRRITGQSGWRSSHPFFFFFLFLKVTKKRKANGRKWGWRKEVKSRRKWKPSRKRNKRNKSKRCKTPVQWTDWITLRLYVRLVRREKKEEEETRRKTQTTHGVAAAAAARLAPAQWKMRRLEKEQNKTKQDQPETSVVGRCCCNCCRPGATHSSPETRLT